MANSPSKAGSRTTGKARPNRPVPMLPPDAATALAGNSSARSAWDRLAPSHRREHVEAITSARQPETRAKRIARMIERLESSRPSLSNTASTRPMLAKMGVGGGQRILLLDADATSRAAWETVPSGSTVVHRGGAKACDIVVLYAATAADLARRLPTALGALADDGVLWIAFPKGSSGKATTLTRDVGWQPTEGRGLAALTLISMDETWSGRKFRRTGSGTR